MMETHTITRRIEIDMGHRVPDHASKCRNIHGHRYAIEATCRGPLAATGEQRGMVVDFGFLKDILMEEIHYPFDHALCLHFEDPAYGFLEGATILVGDTRLSLDDILGFDQKIIGVSFVPTAENLARHWFQRVAPRVLETTNNRARLVQMKVWETPNGAATYEGKE